MDAQAGIVAAVMVLRWMVPGGAATPAQKEMVAMSAPMAVETGEARLEVEIVSAGADSLVFAYMFTNRTRRNAYVFNLLHDGVDEDGRYRTDPNGVYVEIDDGRAIVSKKIMPVPEDIDVEKPVVPCATRVAAGGSFRETVSVALPLRPATPYVDPQAKPAAEARLTLPLWVEIGYFVAPPEGDALARTVQTQQGPAHYFDPMPIARQQLLRVGPLPVSVPVATGPLAALHD